MRLTLLLRLAVAAAASPALNVPLTNNLVGVTTVRVTGAGLRVEATLGADGSLFQLTPGGRRHAVWGREAVSSENDREERRRFI